MAKTFRTQAMGAGPLNHPQMSWAAQWEPEGASQTFTKGSPVVWASGLLVACTSPITTDDTNYVSGLAIEDGHNAAAAATNRCKFIPAIDGVIFYANLMTGDGADYVFAAADLGWIAADAVGCAARSKSGLVTSGVTDWFLDAADTNGAMVISTKPDIIEPNTDPNYVAVGDTNGRVGFVFSDLVRAYSFRVAS